MFRITNSLLRYKVKQQFVQWHQNIRMMLMMKKPSLRGTPQEIAENLKNTLQTRLEVAGVEIIESRISHLAYAQEIAQAMLSRQQAQAVIAARAKIVEGAVGMVQMALTGIK
ncbi:MAG: SPFH domain-containing protein [Ignavibacteriales bacterium]|nr:SPFH domain-containing protein [Ignavibacteriales bacterium]